MRPLLHHDGAGPPARARQVVDGLALRLHDWLERDLRIGRADHADLRLRCASITEYNRATHAFVSEPGTVEWLQSRLRPGDVFFDIGANIGIFSLLAAERVGTNGRIYAFEPHAATVPGLLHNVLANGRQDRVEVLSTALNERAGVTPFHYRSLEPASGLSQLDAIEDPFGRVQTPVISELKMTATIDALVATGTLRPAGLVKIDVDGNELAVLRGMRELLEGPDAPRSIQVELNPPWRDTILAAMADAGYRCVHEHHSQGVQRLLAEAAGPASLPSNGIFERATATDA
jgi:FkbM family methyltransferase